jgi:ketosteroid isomerase-like protein
MNELSMKINPVTISFSFFMVGLITTNSLLAQVQNDKVEILRLRNAYNAALKNFDEELSFSFLTDDVQSTISIGTLIQGKENLREYLRKATGPKLYWVRTPNEIDINTELELAWEAGTWKGYTIDSGNKSVTGGKYSAMWTKINGGWKIKSQLFVKLE